MNENERDRRRFLQKSAVLAGLAVGGIRAVRGQAPEGDGLGGTKGPDNATPEVISRRLYGERSRFEKTLRWSRSGPQAYTPLADQMGIITPAQFHYIVSHGYNPPDINPDQHRLLIHGLVDRSIILTMDELKRLPSLTRIYFLECAGNTSPVEGRSAVTVQQTHGWTSCSAWTGVPLSLLLKQCGVKDKGTWIVAEGAEPGKHTKSIPIEKAMDDVLVVYGQNGEAVRPEQGYPLRLVVPGWEGINNVKWLRRIKVVDEPYMARSESTGYPVLRPNLEGKAFWFNFEMGPKSVITFPSAGGKLSGPGFYDISGIAWSGGGSISKVEISTDGGQTWKDAEIQSPVFSKAHTRFGFGWTWSGKEVMLQSRCIDERGARQPTVSEIAKMWGVPPDYFKTTINRVNHFNAIQSWKVASDGSVINAMV